MSRRCLRVLAFALALAAAHIVQAETFSRGGVFLPLGHGARAHGLGGAAVVSTLDDAAVAWNPANLTWSPQPAGLTFMHAELLPGVDHGYDTASFGRAAGPRLGSGDEVRRPTRYGYGLLLTHLGLDFDTSSWSENAMTLAGAVALENFASVGAGVKLLRVTNDFTDGDGRGVGLDLAFSALVTDRLTAALVLRDAWTRVRFDTRTWQTQPRTLDAGIALRVRSAWLVEVDVRSGTHLQSTAAGLEWNAVRDLLWLRGGWTSLAAGVGRSYPSAGAGLRHERFGLDYGVSFDDAGGLDTGQRVSLHVAF